MKETEKQSDDMSLTVIFFLQIAGGDGCKSLKVSEVKERCMSKGFKPDQIDECIEEYEELNVWSVNQTKITFVD
jgi:hypothetical protein